MLHGGASTDIWAPHSVRHLLCLSHSASRAVQRQLCILMHTEATAFADCTSIWLSQPLDDGLLSHKSPSLHT